MKLLRNGTFLLLVFFTVMLYVLLAAAGCSLFDKEPAPPPANPESIISGRVIVKMQGQTTQLRGVTVKYQGYETQTNAEGRFALTVIFNMNHKYIRLIKDGYKNRTVDLPGDWTGGNVELNKIEMQVVDSGELPDPPDEPDPPDDPEDPDPPPPNDFDFDSCVLRGFSDSYSFWFSEDKFRGMCQEVRATGANCIAPLPDASWGYSSARKGCGGWVSDQEWWQYMHNTWDDGGGPFQPYNSQFAIYEPIYTDGGLNQAWVNLISARVRIAEEEGLYVVLTLWNANDTKRHGLQHWVPLNCGESPFLGSAAWSKQQQAMAALLPMLKDRKNVILSDNWESLQNRYGGSSIDLEWKKLVYAEARKHLPDVPYYVYIDNYTSGDVTGWINSTPGIAGAHFHYSDIMAFPIASNKRVLLTEKSNLSMGVIVPTFEEGDHNGWDVCILVMGYRHFMRYDDAPPWPKDIQKDEREAAYPKIQEYFGLN